MLPRKYFALPSPPAIHQPAPPAISYPGRQYTTVHFPAFPVPETNNASFQYSCGCLIDEIYLESLEVVTLCQHVDFMQLCYSLDLAWYDVSWSCCILFWLASVFSVKHTNLFCLLPLYTYHLSLCLYCFNYCIFNYSVNYYNTRLQQNVISAFNFIIICTLSARYLSYDIIFNTRQPHWILRQMRHPTWLA